MQTTLVAIYAPTLVLCALGAATKDRRRDVRFLITLTAPWILFFAILPHMHERYLVWAAAISVVGAGVGVGMTLLHLLVTTLAFNQMILALLQRDQGMMPVARSMLGRLFPEVGWLVLLLAAVCLYASLAPSRRRGTLARMLAPLLSSAAARMSSLRRR